MTEYILKVVGVPKRTADGDGPGLDISGTEVREHVIHADNDDMAVEVAIKVVSDYSTRLASYRWASIMDVVLYKRIMSIDC